MEEICTAAVKEEMIEAKLSAITARWSSAVFTFADYKTRGPVVLQVNLRSPPHIGSLPGFAYWIHLQEPLHDKAPQFLEAAFGRSSSSHTFGANYAVTFCYAHCQLSVS